MDITKGATRTITVTPRDAQDGLALIHGPAVWTADVEGIVSRFPSPDGLTCEVTGVGAGACVLTVTGDADLGTGVRHITLQIPASVILDTRAVRFDHAISDEVLL